MTIATLKKQIRVEPLGDSNKLFVYLMTRYGARPISSFKGHSHYLELSKALVGLLSDDIDKEFKDGIRQYLSVLAPYIENYETRKWPSKKVSGGEMLEYLRKQHGLTQRDLKSEIGEQPYVSAIEKGKKKLTADQIRKLSKRFGVSPNVFFE